jgi:hypothetical protein
MNGLREARRRKRRRGDGRQSNQTKHDETPTKTRRGDC